jgi:hypothetical protein
VTTQAAAEGLVSALVDQVMTAEPYASARRVFYPYPYPDYATPGSRPSPDGTAPPMPSEVMNEPRQRHSGGRLRMMMHRITRRP